MEEIVLVLTTLPSGFDTESLARELVEARYAACVSVLPPQTSTYRWQGALEMATEHQLLIKTAASRVDDLREALRNRHPYAMPEFMVIPVSSGDPAYLQWVRNSLFES